MSLLWVMAARGPKLVGDHMPSCEPDCRKVNSVSLGWVCPRWLSLSSVSDRQRAERQLADGSLVKDE